MVLESNVATTGEVVQFISYTLKHTPRIRLDRIRIYSLPSSVMPEYKCIPCLTLSVCELAELAKFTPKGVLGL